MKVYKNKKILITGGLGFLGSNLAVELVNSYGAKVTILDSCCKQKRDYINIRPIKNKVTIIDGDITEQKCIIPLLDVDYIFHCAAQTNYMHSPHILLKDLKVNLKGTLNILELCMKYNRSAKVGFASSRFVYGKIKIIPVRESHPTEPMNIYGIHKLTAEHYFKLYDSLGLKTFIIRIPNPYGPGQQIMSSKSGIVGWFLGQAMRGKTLRVFGDGLQKRDYIFVDDLVDAFLLAGASELANGETFNIGSPAGMTFKEMATTIIRIVGKSKIEFVPWPENYERNETGDYIADYSKIQETIGWKPRIQFEEGIKKMYDYYTKYQEYYK